MLRVTGGILARETNAGPEFRQVLDEGTLIAGIHDFEPRLLGGSIGVPKPNFTEQWVDFGSIFQIQPTSPDLGEAYERNIQRPRTANVLPS